MMEISKRAKEELDLMESAKKFIVQVWSFDKGFFENAFTFLSYAGFAALPIAKWIPFLLTAFSAQLLGLTPSRFGAWLDKELGIGPGEVPGANVLRDVESVISKKVEAHKVEGLTKNAGIFSGILRSAGFVKKIVSAIWWLIKLLLKIFGVATLASLAEEIQKASKDFELPNENKKTPEKEPAEPKTTAPPKPKTPKDIDNIDDWIKHLEEKYK